MSGLSTFMMSKRFIGLALVILVLLSLLTGASAHKSDDGEPILVILFMFFGLGVGIVIMQWLSWLGDPVPYTCVVFVAGAVFSVFNKQNSDVFGESVSQWTNINAELLLFVFLPPLIFGEAMYLNWYHVQGGILQSVILAGPGVIIGAVLMGLVAKFILPYGWNWNLAMEFGSILSATDPVAVVALLKSAGASPKLTILIVGESLLNDGTAMVLFAVFFNALNGTVYTIGDIALFFVEAAIGSVVFGMAVGLITVRWLRSANRQLSETDTTAQIAITLCAAYVCFFVAQYTLRISGVLACCGAGVMLAWLAPPIILNHETMHNVWGMTEWVMNTFVFLLAGLIIGNRVLDEVSGLDWFFVFFLYVILMLVRCFIIVILYPFISRIGHKCNRNEAIFMSWAGLRGALGMALALLVNRETPEDIEKETSRLFFYVGGIAALTLIINAPTARQLLIFLGLLGQDSAEKVVMMNHFKRKLKSRMEKVLEEMASEFGFTPQDLDEVKSICSRLTDASNMENLYRESERMSNYVASHINTPSHRQLLADAREEKEDQDSVIKACTAGEDSLNRKATRGSFTRVAEKQKRQSEEKDFDAINETLGYEKSKAGASMVDDDAASERLSLRNPVATETTESAATADGEATGRKSESGAASARTPKTRRWSFMDKKSNPGGDRAGEMSRRLSLSKAEDHPRMTQELLAYVRGIFLEMVRVRYWRDIEQGKLPRLSYSAQFLLYSVEVGVDKVGEMEGTWDWTCVRNEIDSESFIIRMLHIVERITPFFISEHVAKYAGHLEATREKRAVYMLNSFIEAHNHAQSRIHKFLVVDDDGDAMVKSAEELMVIAESQDAVQEAESYLASMNPETVAQIRAKQMAALVLAKEAEMVKSMVEEGLLTMQFATELLEEIEADASRIDKERNEMYRDQMKKHGKTRQQTKKQRRLSKQEEREREREQQRELEKEQGLERKSSRSPTRPSLGSLFSFGSSAMNGGGAATSSAAGEEVSYDASADSSSGRPVISPLARPLIDDHDAESHSP